MNNKEVKYAFGFILVFIFVYATVYPHEMAMKVADFITTIKAALK